MDRSPDPTTMIFGRNIFTNDDNKTECEVADESHIAGKKRPSSDITSEDLEGARRRSHPKNYRDHEDYYIDEQTKMTITEHDVDLDFDDLVEYEDQAGLSPTKSPDQNGQEQQEVAHSDSGDDSINSDDNEILQEEEEKEEEEEEESLDDSGSDDVGEKEWNEFVAQLDHGKETKNIKAYIVAKANRTEATTRFREAAEDCLEALYDITDSMTSDIVEAICTTYSNNLNEEEESIIETMISNHQRRNDLLERMQNANAIWNETYNKLSTQIMGQTNEIEGSGMDGDLLDEEGSGNAVEPNEEQLLSQNHPEEMVSEGIPSEMSNQDTDFGPEDPDWEELYEYEPSQEQIELFLGLREQRDDVQRAFEETLKDVQSGLKSDIDAIYELIALIFEKSEDEVIENEKEIQALLMENYYRRDDLISELDRSQRHLAILRNQVNSPYYG